MTPSGQASELDRVREYLDAPRCAILATVDAGGSPHQAVVHYWLAVDAVMVNGRADRRWVVNLARDPRVSLAVHDSGESEHWVGLKGRANVAQTGEPALDDAMALARRYGGDPDEYVGQDRVSFRILPRRVYEYG